MSPRSVFDLEPKTRIDRSGSYVLSYPYLLSYFEQRDFEAVDLVRGAHMAYGWMPTVLELWPEPPNIDLDRGAELLTRARQDGALGDDEIGALASLINNSLVGASKLLHFVAPEHFAIWDSRIYRFLYDLTPHLYRIKSVERYRDYLNSLAQLRSDPRFPGFHRSVNEKLGYRVSPFRALELIMFLNAPPGTPVTPV
jgi:hypothetical protein